MISSLSSPPICDEAFILDLEREGGAALGDPSNHERGHGNVFPETDRGRRERERASLMVHLITVARRESRAHPRQLCEQERLRQRIMSFSRDGDGELPRRRHKEVSERVARRERKWRGEKEGNDGERENNVKRERERILTQV